MRQVFFYIYLIIIPTSFLTGLTVYLYKQTPRYLKLLTPFLLFTSVINILSQLMALKYGTNHPTQNIYSAVEAPFYLLFLREVIRNNTVKKIAVYTSFLFLVAAAINMLIQGIKTFHLPVMLAGSFLILSFCCYYFYELIKKPVFTALTRQPEFWICSGMLFFYASTLPVFAASSFLENFATSTLDLLGMFLLIANYVYYAMLMVGFLVNMRNHSRQSNFN